MKPSIRYFFFLCALLIPSVSVADTPLSVRGASTIPTEMAKTLFDKGALFVDVRNAARFGQGRIASAVNLDLNGALTAGALEKLAEKDKELVFYCDGVECGRSAIATKLAVDWGYTKVYYYRSGWPSWQKAGLPTEP